MTEFKESGKIISTHQPAYLGWLGYFHKIFYSDIFVIHDAAEFSRKSFIKRTLIKKSNTDESTYLILPALKHSDFCNIIEIHLNETTDWRTSHLRKINSAYNKAPYFREYFPIIESLFDSTRNVTSLVEITSKFTNGILKILEIEREIYFSTKLLSNQTFDNPHEKNIAICKKLGGSIYFSGSEARDYQKNLPFPEGMRLVYQDFWRYLESNPYLERSRFINGLSILDSLFYIGPIGIKEIFYKYE